MFAMNNNYGQTCHSCTTRKFKNAQLNFKDPTNLSIPINNNGGSLEISSILEADKEELPKCN